MSISAIQPVSISAFWNRRGAEVAEIVWTGVVVVIKTA
jgi:hypothetical protein